MLKYDDDLVAGDASSEKPTTTTTPAELKWAIKF